MSPLTSWFLLLVSILAIYLMGGMRKISIKASVLKERKKKMGLTLNEEEGLIKSIGLYSKIKKVNKKKNRNLGSRLTESSKQSTAGMGKRQLRMKMNSVHEPEDIIFTTNEEREGDEDDVEYGFFTILGKDEPRRRHTRSLEPTSLSIKESLKSADVALGKLTTKQRQNVKKRQKGKERAEEGEEGEERQNGNCSEHELELREEQAIIKRVRPKNILESDGWTQVRRSAQVSVTPDSY